MLIVMVVSSAAFGYWVHWSREWIRQRREVIRTHVVFVGLQQVYQSKNMPRAPSGLWLFGDSGWRIVLLREHRREAEVQRLLPESEVALVD
jgi:hypothetical protein